MGPWAIFTMGYSTVAPISCLSIDSILKNQQFCDSNDLPNGLEGDRLELRLVRMVKDRCHEVKMVWNLNMILWCVI